jgi:hypothetical protein
LEVGTLHSTRHVHLLYKISWDKVFVNNVFVLKRENNMENENIFQSKYSLGTDNDQWQLFT